MSEWTTVYLSSLESTRLQPVRACTLIHKLAFDNGKPCALVELDPPISGQDFGIVGDLNRFLITPRHEGSTLFPINEFPLFVFVCLPTRDPKKEMRISENDVQIIGWGELYQTAEDAEHHRFSGPA